MIDMRNQIKFKYDFITVNAEIKFKYDFIICSHFSIRVVPYRTTTHPLVQACMEYHSSGGILSGATASSALTNALVGARVEQLKQHLTA
jgi:hypothetical protein